MKRWRTGHFAPGLGSHPGRPVDRKRNVRPITITLALTLTLVACGHEASLTRETATGGVVTWSVQSDGDILSSAGRRDALRLMRRKCPRGYRMLNEGEIAKVSQKADRNWRGQMGTDRVWGIQFTCEP